MNYLTFGADDKLHFTYNDKAYVIESTEDWDAAVKDIKAAPDYEPQSFMCSSSIDFPEESTDDQDLIELCYAIRSGV